MEQQAKERLTGGVILVVLLVLLVPELLTGPRRAQPPAPAQPDQAPMRSYTMELGGSPHAHEPVAASTAAPPVPDGAPAVGSAAAPAAVSAPAAAPAPASAPSGNATLADQAPASAPPVVAAPAPVAPVRAAPAPAHAPAVAAHPTPTKPAPVHEAVAAEHATEHATETWTVQVGMFSSHDNAAHIVASLKAHGFSPTVSESNHNGHKMFRVRVGTEHDRAAAQKLLVRLKAVGQKGAQVVPR